MLQIITGKFFHTDDAFKHEAYFPLYSNYSWIGDISCSVGMLSPTCPDRTVYVFKYQNQIEKTPDSIIARIGDEEIVNQFKNICIFALQAMFDTEKNNIIQMCGNQFSKLNKSSDILPRYFDRCINGNLQEIEDFRQITDKLLSLHRAKYNVIKRCLSAYAGSLNLVSYNLELAYSMLVYCLETLSQSFDDYMPKWEDYPRNEKIDKLINDLEQTKADSIKNELIKNRNLRLEKRFIEFISKYTLDDFFIHDLTIPPSKGTYTLIRKSEFTVALKNAYAMRSAYTHVLYPLLPHLKTDFTNGDIYRHDYAPYLSYSGLIRLTHHVLWNYIKCQESCEHEDYDWKRDLPNQYIMTLDPMYWISKTDGFHESHAKVKLSGFLKQLEKSITKKTAITDCSELMRLYESLIKHQLMKEKDKIPIIVHYQLYNLFLQEEQNENKISTFDYITKHKYLNKCCIENLLYYTLTNGEWVWEVDECIKQYKSYERRKNRQINENIATQIPLEIPLMFEIAIILNIADKCLEESRSDYYEEWMNYAVIESSNNHTIQNFIKAKIHSRERINSKSLFELLCK